MIRTRRERFDPNRPLIAIKPLTVNGEAKQPGDEISMELPVGLRKRMWKARRCVHKGSRLDGKIITNPSKEPQAPTTDAVEPQAPAAMPAPSMPVPTPAAVAPVDVPEPQKMGSQWGYPELSDAKHRSKKAARKWYAENQTGEVE